MLERNILSHFFLRDGLDGRRLTSSGRGRQSSSSLAGKEREREREREKSISKKLLFLRYLERLRLRFLFHIFFKPNLNKPMRAQMSKCSPQNM